MHPNLTQQGRGCPGAGRTAGTQQEPHPAPAHPVPNFYGQSFPPCPACTQSRVAYTATQLLSAVFVGKRGLKGKALGEKGERGALPLFYLCLCSCMQCNNGVQCPGEPITSRSTAKQGLGHSPLNFLYTVSSSQKSTAAKEKEQSRLPAQTHHPR